MASLNLTKSTVPDVSTQQFIIDSFITNPLVLNAFVCPLSAEWYSDWYRHIQGATSPNFPRPLELSLTGENKILNENTWAAFSKWYGVSANHDLLRFQVKEQSSANFDQDFFVPNIQRYTGSGGDIQPLVPPRFRFLRAEQLGYIMWQMRHHFRMSPLSKTRLWYGYYATSTIPQKKLVTQLSKTLAEIHLACDDGECAIFGPTFDQFANAIAQFPDSNLAKIPQSGCISVEQYYKNSGQYHPIYNRYANQPGFQFPFQSKSAQTSDPPGPPTKDFCLILEVFDETKGKWPTGIHPDQLPTNPFEDMYKLSRIVTDDDQKTSEKGIDEPQSKLAPHSSAENIVAAASRSANDEESLQRATAFRKSLQCLQSNFMSRFHDQVDVFVEETVKAVEDEFGMTVGPLDIKDIAL